MAEDLIIKKELVLGHLARHLPRTTDKGATHHWEIFLYSPTGEDLTKWIKKVVFHLHSSFDNPVRTCQREPYRISEDGWGEFEARVEIFPKSAMSFDLSHMISFPAPASRKPMLIQKRQEVIVFRNPSPFLYEGLTAASFTWNKFKRIKKQPHGLDAELLEEQASDHSMEEKWLRGMRQGGEQGKEEITRPASVKQTSEQIRDEITKLAEKHKAQMERIRFLIDEIAKESPDIAEAASLFL